MKSNKLESYLKRGKPIFVKNMMRKPNAMVSLNFKYNGNLQTVHVPPSAYPFEITSMVSPNMILEGGDDLKKALKSGVLVLVGPKKAKALTAGVEDELDQIFIRANNPTAARSWAQSVLAVSDGNATDKRDRSQEQDKDGNPYVFGPTEVNKESLFSPFLNTPSNMPILEMQKRASSNEAPSRASYQLSIGGGDEVVNPSVLGIMSGWNNETDEGVLAQLKAQASLMVEYDFNYVLSRCNHSSRTYLWAKQKIETNNISKYNER